MSVQNVPASRMIRVGLLVPLAFFIIVAAFFYVALYGDPSRLPSVLIGKAAPEFNLPAIEAVESSGKATPGFSTADLATGEVTVVTVWASWCPPCVQEHPNLIDLKERHGVRLFGINYKDKPADAHRFLTRHGNPFDAIGADVSGRTAIDWGVYGVPETFVVNGGGEVVHKFVGPVSATALQNELLPIIEQARKQPLTKAGS